MQDIYEGNLKYIERYTLFKIIQKHQNKKRRLPYFI